MTVGSPSTARRARAGAREVPDSVVAVVEAHLRQRELKRDELFERARRLRRLAQGTMIRIHADRAAPTELEAVRRGLAELEGWLEREGRGDASLAADALQESVEALVLGAIVSDEPIPGPAELGVEPEPYLLGLGDVVGEVRRLVLDRLARDDLAGAEVDLALMDHLTRTLLGFDTTRAIVPLKPKQDTARALLERTRGEVVMARFLARARPSTRTVEGEP